MDLLRGFVQTLAGNDDSDDYSQEINTTTPTSTTLQIDKEKEVIENEERIQSSSDGSLGGDVIITYEGGGSGGNRLAPESCSREGYDSIDEDFYHIILDFLEHSEYFRGFNLVQVVDQYMGKILSCYDRFCRLSPLHSYGNREFSAAELVGLEYLMNPKEERKPLPNPHQFPPIHLSEPGTVRCIEGLLETFLVYRPLDYIFSFIIEIALLDKGHERIPAYMAKERDYHSDNRMRIQYYNQSSYEMKKGEISKSPHDWLIYTKTSSEFYLYVQGLRQTNLDITYSSSSLEIDELKLSFFLVNYICGPLPSAEQYDSWVAVPLFYLDIWNCRKIERV